MKEWSEGPLAVGNGASSGLIAGSEELSWWLAARRLASNLSVIPELLGCTSAPVVREHSVISLALILD